jgi:hypothetical protein
VSAAAIAARFARTTGASLDELLAAQVLPRSWAARILSACELPSHFERCACDLAPDLAWRAYGDADRPLIVIARAHPSAMDPTGSQTLDIYMLDGHAVVHHAGAWGCHGWRDWRRMDKNHA